MGASRLPGLAVGFFDGVHRGHQAILAAADSALTFRNHPLTVLAPERAPRLIMSFAEREAAIRAQGVGEVRSLEFTPELSELSAVEFARRFLAGYRIRCGANWRFGRGGAGDAALLEALGLEVEVVPYAEWAGKPVSSTRIREALEAGEIEAATAMLAHPYELAGTVERGKGTGRELGYPTVNVRPRELKLRLPRGVYSVWCGETPGIANFGVAPTFGAAAWTEPVLEVHFLTSQPPATGAELKVELRRFLRPERRFANLAALKAQIAADCAAVRERGR